MSEEHLQGPRLLLHGPGDSQIAAHALRGRRPVDHSLDSAVAVTTDIRPRGAPDPVGLERVGKTAQPAVDQVEVQAESSSQVPGQAQGLLPGERQPEGRSAGRAVIAQPGRAAGEPEADAAGPAAVDTVLDERVRRIVPLATSLGRGPQRQDGGRFDVGRHPSPQRPAHPRPAIAGDVPGGAQPGGQRELIAVEAPGPGVGRDHGQPRHQPQAAAHQDVVLEGVDGPQRRGVGMKGAAGEGRPATQ